ncbi:MAG TPA: sporulation initiation factor Spo0A C-terminal domain-containing protein [Firmicutes bacterium]|nr:sporulation initiation factor Spo0A C-terminal domain-containing protein [Bacillota bacterium]
MNTISEKLVQQEVSKCLLGMGIYPNVIGFTNLINSVIAVVEMGNNGPSICEAYKQAGRKINKSAASVERSIRALISKCANGNSLARLNDYFGYPVVQDYPISAGELVCLLATKIIYEILP